ncbi:4'-phosphopantetheinyl transferase family protein [Kitasatospora purpeofusca]|uniref:4'-phosphopantetheinyl transferase family protein n=1 Tax=Kitasatospora purpeofusca TaxID=67352 RepID=UPI002A5AD462|nr:4'-phosphopantetheinyl transferase superfamily protein [Kitasatospora purpeofusca]MDY0816155.1 4'-phosphopantetheinyl transferase superfamily protein [Kitasatospora purpeofusca]
MNARDPGAVELWLLEAAAVAVGPAELDGLDAEEHRRAGRFVRDADRAVYLAAHVALRHVLGRRLGLAPAALAFAREPCPGCAEPHGRPGLAGDAAGAPHFSLSHGGGRVLIGLAEAPVGVDVEPLPKTDSAELLATTLHPVERAELAEVRPGELPGAFARLWTRKEAYLKGLGIGLGRPPAADYLGTAEPARRPAGWAVTDVPAGPRHAAAVALAGGGAAVAFRLRHSLG